MKTRKILTMGFEPRSNAVKLNGEACDGDCYEYDVTLRANDASWNIPTLAAACGMLLGVHAVICGNERLRIGISLDESRSIWIGSFFHYGSEEIVTASGLTECVEELARVVRAYSTSPQAIQDAALAPGRGRNACSYGEDATLVSFMVRSAGVPENQWSTVTLAVRAEAQRAAAIWETAAFQS